MNADHGESLFDSAPRCVSLPGVTVRETSCRTLLNHCGSADYSFNPYTGCTHACGYCYARFMQRFHPHAEPWGAFVDVKINAPQVLARQLRRLPPGAVFTCSACDGWQPLEEHYRLTRRCCELLLDAGFRLNVLTKSRLILRDLDLFAGRAVHVGVTLTTPDEHWARVWEPAAASVAERVRILAAAKERGLSTSVMFGPLLPGISDGVSELRRLFQLAAAAKVDRVWTDILNPRPRVWPAVQAVLHQHAPDLLDHYRRLLFDAAARATYTAQIRARIRQAAAEAGVVDYASC